jgi:hypothetical protein
MDVYRPDNPAQSLQYSELIALYGNLRFLMYRYFLAW